MVNVKRWSYGVRKELSEYGPYICDIYFGLKQIDYHTCCTSKKDVEKLGKFWVDWLKKCDKVFRYNPLEYKRGWLDWYSIAYGKMLFPTKS